MTQTEKEFNLLGITKGGTKFVPMAFAEMMESQVNRKNSVINQLVGDFEGMTDAEVKNICERHNGDIDGISAFIRFLIGQYHQEKSRAEAYRLKYEREVATNG
jgi:hypothetical protein